MRLMQRLRSTRGESLTESLVGVLIISLVVIVLAAAIVVATNLNTQVSNQDTAFTYGTKAGTVQVAISVPGIEGGDAVIERDHYVSVTSSDREYHYYEEVPSLDE